MNVDCSIAVRTPMSRTRPARTPNSRDSAALSPNSFTSVAPGAENRSVIWVFIVALWAAASRESRAIAAPMRRAGIRNSGSTTSAASVICQEMLSITASVNVNVTRLATTPDRVSENARCAPITSLPSRLTSAPVRVRVKNATGIRCTWSNTAVRRSRISPSPMVDDSHRVSSATPASATATAAMTAASATTTATLPAPVISSTTRPANSGVATVSTAPTTLTATNTPSLRWCRAAKRQIRPSNRRSPSECRSPPRAWVCRYSDCRATVSKLMFSP